MVKHTRASWVDQGKGRIVGWPPETFSAAGVEFRYFLRESQSRVAEDLADLELTARAPVLALLRPSDWIRQLWAEVG